MLARIDPATYTPLPWLPNTARFAADLHVDDKPHPFCPRVNLKRVLAEVRRKGYVFNVGMEPEHFLVMRQPDGTILPWDPDSVDGLAKPCYDFRSMAPALAYLQEVTESLNHLGWGVYQADHEDANGQFEINFQYADALTTADRITFFKMTTSQLCEVRRHCQAHGQALQRPHRQRAARPLPPRRRRDGQVAVRGFVRSRGLGCSALAYHFLGGVFQHARALCAVTSPTVNCYKRLQLGAGVFSSRSGFTWTPAFITYGDNNRTQMVRTAGPGHFEDRTVSAGCNPYLALSGVCGGGPGRHRQETRPRRAEPGQYVRVCAGGSASARHPYFAAVAMGGAGRIARR